MCRSACLLGALAASLLWACGGEQHTIDSSWSEAPVEEHQPTREAETLDQGATPVPLTADKPQPTWLGVRPDVMIAPSAPHEAKCNCLAVHVGGAKDSAFQWQNEVPTVGSDARVIAVSTRGVPCSGDSKGRASISAVDRDGSDVVVEVEELPDGRPIASGAVIPAPGPGGSIYVRGKNKNVPYARGSAGGRCKVQ